MLVIHLSKFKLFLFEGIINWQNQDSFFTNELFASTTGNMTSDTGVYGSSPMWIQVDEDCTNEGTLFMYSGKSLQFKRSMIYSVWYKMFLESVPVWCVCQFRYKKNTKFPNE